MKKLILIAGIALACWLSFSVGVWFRPSIVVSVIRLYDGTGQPLPVKGVPYIGTLPSREPGAGELNYYTLTPEQRGDTMPYRTCLCQETR